MSFDLGVVKQIISRRMFLFGSTAVFTTFAFSSHWNTPQLNSELIIANGWILKKTDLDENLNDR